MINTKSSELHNKALLQSYSSVRCSRLPWHSVHITICRNWQQPRETRKKTYF